MPNFTGYGYPVYGQNTGNTQLQSTISAATSGIGELPYGVAHHPITCSSTLYFEDDGTFGCDHGKVPPEDKRTHACLVHSLALLIVELGMNL